jgi:hypothetical protein
MLPNLRPERPCWRNQLKKNGDQDALIVVDHFRRSDRSAENALPVSLGGSDCCQDSSWFSNRWTTSGFDSFKSVFSNGWQPDQITPHNWHLDQRQNRYDHEDSKQVFIHQRIRHQSTADSEQPSAHV